VPKAVERREPADRALLQDDPRSRDPVGLFAIDQVTDDVEGAPGVAALVRAGPGPVEPAEERAKGRRSIP